MCEDGSDPDNNSLNGPLLLSSIKDSTKELKDYSTKTLKGLKKVADTKLQELDVLAKLLYRNIWFAVLESLQVGDDKPP